MCPAVHIAYRSWLRSSSTCEPSDPPPRVVPCVLGGTPGVCIGRVRAAGSAAADPGPRPVLASVQGLRSRVAAGGARAARRRPEAAGPHRDGRARARTMPSTGSLSGNRSARKRGGFTVRRPGALRRRGRRVVRTSRVPPPREPARSGGRAGVACGARAAAPVTLPLPGGRVADPAGPRRCSAGLASGFRADGGRPACRLSAPGRRGRQSRRPPRASPPPPPTNRTLFSECVCGGGARSAARRRWSGAAASSLRQQ